MFELWCGDCIALMQNIENNSIDCIICDLPYGTQKKNGCKWDIVIDFNALWKQYHRIIKPNGAIVLFGKEPFSSLLRVSNIEEYKYDWVWVKDTKSNFMQASYQPLNNIELISVFSKGYAREIESNMKMVYNPQFIDSTPYKIPKESKTTEIFSTNHKNGVYRHKERDTSKRYPYVLLHFNAVKGKEKVHPTQKPVELLEYLIKTYTNEGEIILDNCMGSGSTGVACKNLNRRFIGIEKDTKYFEIAKERINNAIKGK